MSDLVEVPEGIHREVTDEDKNRQYGHEEDDLLEVQRDSHGVSWGSFLSIYTMKFTRKREDGLGLLLWIYFSSLAILTTGL
jgi:hypothetical protein